MKRQGQLCVLRVEEPGGGKRYTGTETALVRQRKLVSSPDALISSLTPAIKKETKKMSL